MMVAQSPCSRSRSAASSGETSQKSSGCSSARCGERARHAARRVMLGEAIGREHVRKALVGERGVGIVGTLLPIGRRIRLRRSGYSAIAERRFQRLVVRRQRTVLQSAGDEQPGDSVGMQDERLVAGDGIHALRAAVGW